MKYYGLLTLLCLVFISPFAIEAGERELSGFREAPPPNLLRNSDFQDDWLTLVPELKNHHWNYLTEVYNRRDYNPDAWRLSGNWDWRNADGARGQRRLVLVGNATVEQSVNWVLAHNPARLSGWPDGGGYPAAESRNSAQPSRVVRDLTFQVWISGRNLPENPGSISVSYGNVSESVPVPSGSYKYQRLEVTLPASAWIAANRQLPQEAGCAIQMGADGGEMELHYALLTADAPESPNLLANGEFDALDQEGYPVGWSQPEKYIYFPPGIYYNFNTWHNTAADNRGPVQADPMVSRLGRYSLKMIMPTGDEKSVSSAPIALNQTEARLIEVTAWVKTDKLAMMQIDAHDEQGRRLECYNFIQKGPLAIGSGDWRLVRQVFSPRHPVAEVTIQLAARGKNGYTLSNTTLQPQNNKVGTIWWDGIRVYEPESTAAELAARDVTIPSQANLEEPAIRLENLEPGEHLFGENTLRAVMAASARGRYKLVFEYVTPSGETHTVESKLERFRSGARTPVELTYTIDEPCPAYREFRGKLKLVDSSDEIVAESDLWFGGWTTPMNIRLGNLFPRPERNALLVRINAGLTAATMQRAATMRLELIRRGSDEVLQTVNVPAGASALEAQRSRIPSRMYDDFRNMLLSDLDISGLPVQPFNNPQRNWLVRATLLDGGGETLASVDSQPFCRLATDAPQPPVESVHIDKDGDLYVNDRPWMPWGVSYLHNPVYEGLSTSGSYHDLRNLPGWNVGTGHGGNLGTRKASDATSWRSIVRDEPDRMRQRWESDNLYASTAFIAPQARPAWRLADIGGPEKADPWLEYARTGPNVVSVGPGIEEVFGHFTNADEQRINELRELVDYMREKSGRPVMVGHGGYWNRYELERATFFDVFDPETEPWYPAPLHTDMLPLIGGQAKTAWLRPQMYECKPYERWRYHVYVEMMRGCRGWQVAHGPGDPSTFRGLQAELRMLQPYIYSKAETPEVSIEPWVENMVRQHNDETLVLAAVTHGIRLGTWRWDESQVDPHGETARVTDRLHAVRDEGNGFGVHGIQVPVGPSVHGIQHLPGQREWPSGSKLTQWIKIDPDARPDNLMLVVKADGRWTHMAQWGDFDVAGLRSDLDRAFWFLRTFYRHSKGFLGWAGRITNEAVLPLVAGSSTRMGDMPAAGEWIRLEVSLDDIGALDELIDGVGAMHANGRVWWGRTTLVAPDGTEQVVFGENLDRPAPEQLANVRFNVPGLQAGATVQVLFEDRELTAGDGFFTDDLSGEHLYQRYGGLQNGYGDKPVATRAYLVRR